MAVLTELELRQMIHDRGEVESITIAPGTIVTPAARQFLQERRIRVIGGEGARGAPPAPACTPAPAVGKASGSEASKAPPAQADSEPAAPKTKPEYMTALRGKLLVSKTHPRIRLRGKLDSVEAYILLAQGVARRQGQAEMDRNLGEVLQVVRLILRAEVLEEPLEPPSLFGLDDAQLRQFSHHPRQHLGVDHFMPSADHGEMMAWLNLVRTQVREAELLAMRAFWQEAGPPERVDLIQALNRLSSAVYILMCKVLATEKGVQPGAEG